MSIEMNGGEANNILETINFICTKQYVSYDKNVLGFASHGWWFCF